MSNAVILDDLAVTEPADDDAVERDGSTPVGSMEGPARGHPILLRDLIVDIKAEIREDRAVEADRFARAGMTSKHHAVDVVDELLVVEVGNAVQLAGARNLDRGAGGRRQVWLD